MKANKAFKFLLKPTITQEQVLVNWTGAGRYIWNQMLEANKTEYDKNKKFIWPNTFALTLPGLKHKHEWLKDIPSQALQQRCLDMDKALKAAAKSRGRTQFGFPKFKKKHIGRGLPEFTPVEIPLSGKGHMTLLDMCL